MLYNALESDKLCNQCFSVIFSPCYFNFLVQDLKLFFSHFQLTTYLLTKESSRCKRIEDLKFSDSVKKKAADFVKKYMAKFGAVYKKSPPSNWWEIHSDQKHSFCKNKFKKSASKCWEQTTTIKWPVLTIFFLLWIVWKLKYVFIFKYAAFNEKKKSLLVYDVGFLHFISYFHILNLCYGYS